MAGSLKPRVAISQTSPQTVKIEIRLRRRPVTALVVGLFWSLIVLSNVRAVESSGLNSSSIFMKLLGAFANMGMIPPIVITFLVITVIWTCLVGSEAIEADASELLWKRRLFGPFSLKRNFPLAEVRNLRISQVEETASGMTSSEDHLAFDFHGRTVRLARNLSNEELKSIYDALQKAIPLTAH